MSAKRRALPISVGEGPEIYAYVTMLGGEEEVASRTVSFGAVPDAVERIAEAMTGAFAKIKPDKASVEFNLEIAIKSGQLVALFAGAESSAGLKVALEWGGKGIAE